MGKSVRTVLLSVSATLAIAMFITLWAVRPASESAVLDEAKARQDQSLVEISRPLETDLRAISDAEALSEEVMEIILSDEDFLARLAEAMVANQSLRDAIAAELGPEVATLVADAMVRFIEDNRAEFDRIIDEEIVSYVAANYDAGIEIVNSEIEAYARENRGELIELIRNEVEKRISQALDDNLSVANAYTDEAIGSILSLTPAYAEELVRKIVDEVVAKVMEEIKEQGYTAAIGIPGPPSSITAIVTIPDFESLPQTDSSTYKEVRANIRQGALDELLPYLN